MNLKEALMEGKFLFTETEEEFINISHCWEKCVLENIFPTIHIMDCPKCNTRLTIKELVSCFIWNKI